MNNRLAMNINYPWLQSKYLLFLFKVYGLFALGGAIVTFFVFWWHTSSYGAGLIDGVLLTFGLLFLLQILVAASRVTLAVPL
jgi:hypothetical protein